MSWLALLCCRWGGVPTMHRKYQHGVAAPGYSLRKTLLLAGGSELNWTTGTLSSLCHSTGGTFALLFRGETEDGAGIVEDDVDGAVGAADDVTDAAEVFENDLLVHDAAVLDVEQAHILEF